MTELRLEPDGSVTLGGRIVHDGTVLRLVGEAYTSRVERKGKRGELVVRGPDVVRRNNGQVVRLLLLAANRYQAEWVYP